MQRDTESRMITRKSARYRVEYSASFSGERISTQGVILDLSLEGGRARSAGAFTKGEFYGVLIDVPRYENPLHVILAAVRWSNGEEFGMEFIRMGPEDQQQLRELIREMEAAKDLKSGQADPATPKSSA